MTIETKINPTEALAKSAKATKVELQRRAKEERDATVKVGNMGVPAYLRAAMR